MFAHSWELRADVRPLDHAAIRWAEIGQLMARRADDLVAAARHALDGWDAAAAESYEDHRRQVIVNLDHFTTLAGQVSASLRALGSAITAGQKELDQAWVNVSLVPHQVVGPDRRLVFQEADDEDRGMVTRCELEAAEIRRRLTLALDQESTRLRAARAEFMLVRASLHELVGGAFPELLGSGVEASGVGVIAPASTSVRGSAESGAGVAVGVGVGLAPIGPILVSMPSLSGLATTGLAPVIGAAAGGAVARRAGSGNGSGSGQQSGGLPPVGGGMAAGAVRGASSLRGGGAGRRTGGGSGSLVTPRLAGEDDTTRAVRRQDPAKEAAREAKRAELAERRAARAARKAEREAEREAVAREGTNREVEEVEVDEAGSARLSVVEVAPGEQPRAPRL